MHLALIHLFNSPAYQHWSIDLGNPSTDKEIRAFLPLVIDEFIDTEGFDGKLRELVDKSRDLNKWWNIFSELRTAHFIQGHFQQVIAFNAERNGKLIDFKLSDGRFCDVTSFLPNYEDPPSDKFWTNDESVVRYLSEKIRKKIEVQGADLVVIDDIFAFNSQKNALQRYFAEQATTTRSDVYSRLMGELMSKWVYLTFVKTITVEPFVIYGESFLKKLS